MGLGCGVQAKRYARRCPQARKRHQSCVGSSITPYHDGTLVVEIRIVSRIGVKAQRLLCHPVAGDFLPFIMR